METIPLNALILASRQHERHLKDCNH